jgi:hypothetical protein
MTDDKKKFSVSELADALNVPRTTVNDWLSRYSQYIDFRMQGKRKIYLEGTLKVLEEISELRNSGMSSFDIEEELVKRHPLNVEDVTHEQEKKEEPKQEAAGNAESAEKNEFAGEEFALTLKKQTDEIGKMISEKLMNMSNRMDEIENSNRVANEKAGRWHNFAMALLVLFVVAVAFSAYKISEYLKQNKTLEFEKKNYAEKLTAKEQALESTSIKLQRDTRNFEDNIRKLNSEMADKEKEFKEMLDRKMKDAETKKQAELLKAKDQFAQERLELLKRLDDAVTDKKTKDEIINKLQQQNLEQSAALKNLSEKVETKEEKPEPEKDSEKEKSEKSE